MDGDDSYNCSLNKEFKLWSGMFKQRYVQRANFTRWLVSLELSTWREGLDLDSCDISWCLYQLGIGIELPTKFVEDSIKFLHCWSPSLNRTSRERLCLHSVEWSMSQEEHCLDCSGDVSVTSLKGGVKHGRWDITHGISLASCSWVTVATCLHLPPLSLEKLLLYF